MPGEVRPVALGADGGVVVHPGPGFGPLRSAIGGHPTHVLDQAGGKAGMVSRLAQALEQSVHGLHPGWRTHGAG